MKKWACDILNLGQPLPTAIANHKIVSFDIFDTLIIRRCGTPRGIFRLVEEKFNGSHATQLQDFPAIRINAEMKVRKSSSKQEITLDEIYAEIGRMLDFQTAGLLRQFELETEYEQCKGRKDIVDIYNKVVVEKNVIITSDMYLPIDIIRYILSKSGITQPQHLYLSSEVDATKNDGTLYKLVIKDLGCAPSEILHIGDNLKGDFIRPKQRGLHSYIIGRQ